MTHLQAINTIEDKLTQLGLTDRFGEPIKGMEAAGIVAQFQGPIWDEVINHFEFGRIDIETYVSAMEMMIEEFDRHRYRSSLEKIVALLGKKQKGVA